METNCRKLVSACVQLDSEIKKVEFTDSPESRKEAASSKLFPRQHPGANAYHDRLQLACKVVQQRPLSLARSHCTQHHQGPPGP